MSTNLEQVSRTSEEPVRTLRTYQRAGCDDELVTLKCPPGTSISIEIAQYGKSAPSKSLCGIRSTPAAVSRNSYNYNISCLWPSAIQTVVEACQKKRQCKFQTSPKTFGGDPCPGVRKYVEVAYKCRPCHRVVGQLYQKSWVMGMYGY
ncbi:hypothetical protein JTB14_003313 [Gonioctena quinquepunctata]|nr:hypothetical protein JTB14_003313 [Gonioctena quinquepunctata]